METAKNLITVSCEKLCGKWGKPQQKKYVPEYVIQGVMHMLHLIFGRAGSGKTEYARSLACEIVRNGGEAMMLVPEQGSFECERDLLHRLGPKDVRRADVLSFTRLCNLVGREYGGLAGRRLDDTGRALFMSMAIEQVKDRLELYRRAADSSEFIELLLSMSSACKMGAVSPEKLSEAAGRTSGTLRLKMQELGLILGTYDALVATQFTDPLDDLTRLTRQLTEHDFFRGRTVILDAFKGFTIQEFDVLEQLMAQAQDCWITLCADGLHDNEHGAGLFSNVKKTARRLEACAKRHGVTVAPPVVLEPGARFASEGLAAVERRLFRADRGKVCNDGTVVLASATNKYEEAAWIAAEIHRMVREEGCRWRDITVIVRREEDYAGVLDRALERAGIPCFMDTPADVTGAPLMAYTLAALDAVNSNMDADTVFRCLKTGLFGLTTDEIAELENYVFLWGLNRDAWDNEWKGNPQGFTDQFGEEEQAALTRLNEMRAQISAAFTPLRTHTRRGTGADMAKAVYEFLCATHADEHLTGAAADWDHDGEPDTAQEQLRLWKLLMGLLDQTALVLQQELDGKRYARLLEMAIRSAKLGELPQSLDEVTVGGADRTRPANPKVVFLAGAVQGVFPASAGAGGLFTEHERRMLLMQDIEIAKPAEEQTVEERFLAYMAASSPSQKLVVSYYNTSSSGEGTLPSELVTEIRRICGAEAVSCSRYGVLPETVEEAFDRLTRTYNEPTAEQAAYRAFFASSVAPEVLEAVDRTAVRRTFGFEDDRMAKALFGNRMRLSPSRVENYYQCPFQYFCRYGMDARERRPAKIDALEYGTLIHYLLEHAVAEHRTCPIHQQPQEDLRQKVRAWMTQYLEERLGGAEGKTQRFLALYRRFEEVAMQLLLYIGSELAQSRFEPAAFELTIGPGKDVQPIRIPLPDGASIEIIGQIDRVDLLEEKGETYVRVIDYKTGHKKFALSDLMYGINMQMLIYLMTLSEQGWQGKEMKPAGVLYLPARSPRIQAAHTDKPEQLEEECRRAMRMSGMVLYDEDILHAMELRNEGIYIPAKLKQDGTPYATSSLYTMEQFGVLTRHMKDLIGKMAAHLRAGEIPAMPLENICEWCSFASVCGREKKDPVQPKDKCDAKEAFRRMAEKESMQ
jgi:ATP-dependent helicase/nuclease subunit B